MRKSAKMTCNCRPLLLQREDVICAYVICASIFVDYVTFGRGDADSVYLVTRVSTEGGVKSVAYDCFVLKLTIWLICILS